MRRHTLEMERVGKQWTVAALLRARTARRATPANVDDVATVAKTPSAARTICRLHGAASFKCRRLSSKTR